MNFVAYLPYVFYAWCIICFIIFLGMYLADDDKFGRFNLSISLLFSAFFFISPIFMPIFWVCQWIGEKLNKD